MPDRRRVVNSDFEGDPEVPNEEDPEFQEAMFKTYLHMGWKPEDLRLKEDQDEYRDWLIHRPAVAQ